ncbi:DUF1571 domain-containing protein [Alienimonas californiensis]|uniref:DUF1571 domain-containing protein n=1 Tax=Alienimonas californiensis TaxID=2527989 RepID=A0A517PDA4_9PLAN|nr:DUF1571 domain-containing protein [Alienimonas californiensis]QDT17355.1 hypothetical protein CA12_34760 [Alienimonas californiensis]
MLRPLPVLGSSLLICGAWMFVDGALPEAPAAPNNGPSAPATAAAPETTAELLRVASVDANPRLFTGNSDPSMRALLRSIELLRDGLERLDAVPAYAATFEKREVVDGVLLEGQAMDMTLRHEPFGVHLAWVAGQRGRTLLYEAGRNDGEMLVNPGGWKGRLTGTLRLDPEGSLAMREARHPVSKLGMGELAATLLRYRLKEIAAGRDVTCTLSDGDEHDGRPAWRNELEYASPESGGEFRRSVVLIDREWNLPVRLETYGWPAADVPLDQLDERTLTGRYVYTNVDFNRFGDAAPLDDLAELTGFQIK